MVMEVVLPRISYVSCVHFRDESADLDSIALPRDW
jgi:hypothetical protein